MSFDVDQAGIGRVTSFFHDRIGRHLRRPEQRESFATYAFGILNDGDRKSVEPIAARATGNAAECKKLHERLVHFLAKSPWSDGEIRREAAGYVIEALAEREPITTWIIDDTGFPKQGTHSVGVQRQYSGTLGKIANCQVGVSLVIATRTEQVPIDFELYLPESWANDPERRQEARVPESVVFKTKPDIALDLITRAAQNGIPGDIVLADCAYGESCDFRETVRLLGLDYAVAVQGGTKVWLLDKLDRRRGEAIAVQELGIALGPKAFRKFTWREGTAGKLHSRFCFRRVKVAHDEGMEPAQQRESIWLVIEWPPGEAKPTKFALTTLRRRMSKKRIIRILKERWRTERAYQELKGELGLDHFEGRSFPGWHHHISVVLCCYAFIVAERVRHFPPSARWQDHPSPVQLAA